MTENPSKGTTKSKTFQDQEDEEEELETESPFQ